MNTISLANKGVQFVKRRLESMQELFDEDNYDVVFNCLGIGAASVCNDTNLIPIRGQLIRVHFCCLLPFLFFLLKGPYWKGLLFKGKSAMDQALLLHRRRLLYHSQVCDFVNFCHFDTQQSNMTTNITYKCGQCLFGWNTRQGQPFIRMERGRLERYLEKMHRVVSEFTS